MSASSIGSRPPHYDPPATSQTRGPSIKSKITALALAILGVLASFLFLPSEVALCLSLGVGVILFAYFYPGAYIPAPSIQSPTTLWVTPPSPVIYHVAPPRPHVMVVHQLLPGDFVPYPNGVARVVPNTRPPRTITSASGQSSQHHVPVGPRHNDRS